MIDYKTYWENRYKSGSTSGLGSYGNYAELKSNIINKIIDNYSIKSICDFGCGDGNQISTIKIPSYTGYDISQSAVDICKHKYTNDPTKTFKNINEYNDTLVDMNMSLDVIYHIIDENDLETLPFEKEILLPVVRAQDCFRYGFTNTTKYVIYPYKEENNKTVLLTEKELSLKFPKAYEYLKKNKSELLKRKDSRKEFSENKSWYSLTRFGKYSTFQKAKIVSPGEVKNNKFGIDETGSGFSCARVFAITIESEVLNLKTLLGILNSKLIQFYLHSVAPLKQGGYYSYSSTFIDSIPLPNEVSNPNSEEIKEC